MEGATSVLFQYGLAGVAIFAMAIVIVTLYKDNKQLQKEKEELLDARRLDAKETVDNISGPLQGISQGINSLADKIELVRRRK